MNTRMLLLIVFGFVYSTNILAAPDANRLLLNQMNNPLFKTEGTLTGEGVCWHAAYGIDRFMDEFRKTTDPAFLDAAVRYFDALIEKMHVSPDGYKGWVGPYIYDENYICDVHVGDAILINPMLEFSEFVLKHGNGEIQQKYREKANRYVELARKHLIEKWDARKTWHEDGSYGAYSSWDRYMTPDNLSEWRVLPATKSTLSLPFNKQNTLGIASLRLYRITGEPSYRERALKIFNFMKSRMGHFQDHIVWNYWEPFGSWDIDTSAPNTLRHWVNVHPYRNYQAGEIEQIVEAYHSGITFSRDDIQRMINTNLKVMWNGDKNNPQWKNSNYGVEMASIGKQSITQAPGGEFTSLAGTLWRGLSDFDSTIRELAGIQDSTPPSFQRQYSDLPVTEFEVPFHNNCDLIMVAVIPSIVASNAPSFLISHNRIASPVEIALYSSDGKNKMQDIRQGKSDDSEGLLIIPWDHPAVAPGEYRIRWTVKNDYREFPITLQ